MKCSSKVQAERVAIAGARKMTAPKYQIKGSAFRGLRGECYTVRNLEANVAYSVGVKPGKEFCSCKFYRENREFKTCKHIVRCSEESAIEARLDEAEKMMEAAWGEDCARW